jgi:hypothetical protein
MKGLKTIATLNGILISGKTYDVKEQLKALGGVWQPEEKSWLLPSGTDLSTITPPAPAAPVAKAKAMPSPKPFWICCDDATIIDYARQMHYCKRCGRDNEHVFRRGMLYTGD